MQDNKMPKVQVRHLTKSLATSWYLTIFLSMFMPENSFALWVLPAVERQHF